MAEGLVLVLLGSAALACTLASDLYLNYVQQVFRPFLVAAGAVLLLLGAAAVVSDLRLLRRSQDQQGHAGGDGREHEHTPKVAWLLLLPVVGVFAIAPPALGAYTVNQEQSAPPVEAEPVSGGRYDDWPESKSEPMKLEIQDFVVRAWTDQLRRLAGQQVRLTGFAVPAEEGEGWYLARLQMACCAADAIVNKVLITNRPAPEPESWWTVQGTWVEPEGDLLDVQVHRFEAATVTKVENPPDPYE